MTASAPTASRYHIVHETSYNYESPVSLSRQSCLAHRIMVTPEPTHSRSRFDHFGNPVTQLDIEAPHSCLTVLAESTVEVRPHLPSDTGSDVRSALPAYLKDSPAWEDAAGALAYGATPVRLEANRFLFESPYVRVKHEFSAYARPSFGARRPLLDAVYDLMRRIHGEFEFDPEATTVSTPVLKILEDKRGVCQDFAHLMLACLRSQGLSARYVSGYLLTQPPPGQPRMIGADASHAWISVYCPRADGGIWIDFDPTNNLLPDRQHITLAWGRDFGDVSPLRGVILGGEAHELDVAVTVTPCDEAAAPDAEEGR
jgi:transglutaminase-like putative cysteine protease